MSLFLSPDPFFMRGRCGTVLSGEAARKRVRNRSAAWSSPLSSSFHTVAEIYICRKTIKYRRYYGVSRAQGVRLRVLEEVGEGQTPARPADRFLRQFFSEKPGQRTGPSRRSFHRKTAAGFYRGGKKQKLWAVDALTSSIVSSRGSRTEKQSRRIEFVFILEGLRIFLLPSGILETYKIMSDTSPSVLQLRSTDASRDCN